MPQSDTRQPQKANRKVNEKKVILADFVAYFAALVNPFMGHKPIYFSFKLNDFICVLIETWIDAQRTHTGPSIRCLKPVGNRLVIPCSIFFCLFIVPIVLLPAMRAHRIIIFRFNRKFASSASIEWTRARANKQIIGFMFFLYVRWLIFDCGFALHLSILAVR